MQHRIERVFLAIEMDQLVFAARQMRTSLLAVCVFLAAGCFGHAAGYVAYSTAGGGTEAAVGEEHEVNFAAQDAFVLAQDVLRADGILFTARPDQSLVTNWMDADEGPGILPDLIGVRPRYRYEIRAVPVGARLSRIIVNIRAEDMPTDELVKYKASARLGLFAKIDQLAKTLPPSNKLPTQGGVNFALLPNEDLKALAKRVTGTENNWQQIAKDNGLTSPTDLAGVHSVWISSRLLDASGAAPASGAGTP